MPNGFMWFDVTSKPEDVQRVTDFYTEVFDGPINPAPPEQADGPYKSWMMNEEQPWAAVVEEKDQDSAGRWLPYVHVDDLEKATEAAIAAGGTLVAEKTKGPAGYAVTIADPAGAHVALWVPFD